MEPPSIAIIGIGSLLFSDQGLGMHIIKNLMQQRLPKQVEVIEGGPSGLNLIPWMDERQKVIFVSAFPSGNVPGTIRRMQPSELESVLKEQPRSGFKPKPAKKICETDDSEDEVDHPSDEEILMETINLAGYLGISPEVVIIGVEPALTEPGMTLSTTLQKMLPDIITVIKKEISKT